MDFTNIITLVLTSSAISAGLTAFVNWIIQKRNYQNDYFKKLLDKRIDAYEEVEDLASRMTNIVRLGNGKTCNFFCFAGYKHFTEFLISVRVPIKKSFWLSDNISSMLTELNIFLLNEIENKIDENGDKDEQLIELGALNIEKFRTMRKNIQAELYKDLKDLHNIEKFVRELKDEHTYPLYDKPDRFRKTN
jgi:hypothetical protein